MKNLITTATILLTLTCLTGCGDTKRHYYQDMASNADIEKNSADIAALTASIDELVGRLDSLEIRVGQSLEDIAACCDALTIQVGDANSEVEALNTTVNNFSTTLTDIDVRITVLEDNVGGITKVGNDLIIEGCNLLVRDGSGDDERVSGVGNIIVGRDETGRFLGFYERDPIRSGANNIIVGGSNEYSGDGGICVGALNKLEGNASAVFSCENTVRGEFSTVTGGTNGIARGKFSCVSGGRGRTVNNDYNWQGGEYFSTR